MCRLTQQLPVRAHRRILARSLQARRMGMRLRMSYHSGTVATCESAYSDGIRQGLRDHDTPAHNRAILRIRPSGSIHARQCHALACSVYCGGRLPAACAARARCARVRWGLGGDETLFHVSCKGARSGRNKYLCRRYRRRPPLRRDSHCASARRCLQGVPRPCASSPKIINRGHHARPGHIRKLSNGKHARGAARQ